MKMAKRVLAVIIAVIMIVGTCAVAASAAYTTTVADGKTTITLSSDTTETLTFNSGDVTIDLGGHKLQSEYGRPAIIINGGNVTVKNGQVVSRFARVSSMEMIQTAFTNSPSGIVVNGGNLTVEGVRVIGSLARVPTTTDYSFPTGTAIMTKNGATVTLKQATLIGDYGVNDRVTGSQAGGAVTIEDAMIIAYNKIVKSGLDSIVLGENTEMINAADRVEGFLNNGVRLEANERKIIKDVFDERAFIFTKFPTDAQKGKITVTEGEDLATVEADTISYVWPNTTSTDCSYELVPEAVVYSDGTSAALNAVDAAKVDEDAQIRYRVKFHLCDDAAAVLKKFAEDPQYWIDLNWWGQLLEDEYVWNDTNEAGDVDSYNEVVKMIGETLRMLDDMGNEKIGGIYVDEIDLYNELRIAILELGGAVAYNKTGRTFEEAQYEYYYGTVGQTKTEDDYAAANGVIGTLDRVQKLWEAAGTFRPFTNTSKWGDIVVWAYDNYDEFLDIIDDASDKISALAAILNPAAGTDERAIVDGILDLAPDMKSAVKLVVDYADKIELAADMIDDVLAYGDVAAALDALEANKDMLKTYADKIVNIANNLDTYVTVSDFVSANGSVVKAYAVNGDVTIERIAAASKLDLRILGEGAVAYSIQQASGTKTDTQTEAYSTYAFVDSFTLTAAPATGWELLYWVDTASNRILSTETALTLTTNIDRDITAVYQPTNEPLVTYTNPTGDIAGLGGVDGLTLVPYEVDDPFIPGFAFTGWPTSIDSNQVSSYYEGTNSPFANPNAFYDGTGYTLLVRHASLSFIVTPKYDRSADMTVKLVDTAINHTYVAKGPFGNVTDAVTAQGENFSYWAINNKPVNLNATYSHTIVEDQTVITAVYGAANVPKVVTEIVSTKNENGVVSFYCQRSSTVAVKSAGIVFSFTNATPELGQEGAIKGTAKYTTQDGMYIPGAKVTSIQSMGNGTIYARPFVETADGITYGAPITYTLG